MPATRQMALIEALSGGDCLTTAELTERLGMDRRQVADVCSALVSQALIVRRERGCFQLAPSGRDAWERGDVLTFGPRSALSQATPRRRRRETQRDRIWRAIRITRKFTLAELQTLSGASGDNVNRYVWALEKAGFLCPLRREPGAAPTSNGFKRWALIRDPGALPPVWQGRKRRVYDPNSGDAIEVRS